MPANEQEDPNHRSNPMPYASRTQPHGTCEELARNEPTKYFSNDFLAVALFSGIGLAVSLIAVICREQGSWF
jgi:hypothetical protein